MKMYKMKKIFLIAIVAVLLASCGGNSYKYEKSPVDKLLVAKSGLANFSISLSDMDYDEPADKYKHQYKIIYQPNDMPDTLLIQKTDWYVVSPTFFKAHENDLGMALVTVKNFVAEKQVSPPGYSDYVGNEKYGRWENRSSGGGFWQFYGQYMFMSTMFRMASPVRYSHYGDYRTHRSSGSTYYGRSANGSTRYGTNSASAKSSTKWGSKSSSFKQRVSSKVSRSASRAKRSRLSSRNSTRRGSTTRRSYGGGYGK
jgi:hypothetical protein